MDRKFVKPAREGLVVLDPAMPQRQLPADGMLVEANHYWLRRLNDGDVVECQPPADEVTGVTR